jgi:hypothetical protein
MFNRIPMANGKIKIQTLTHRYQEFLDPDNFQNGMYKLVQDMENVKTYLDDLLLLTNSNFKDHPFKLEMVLSRFPTKDLLV